MKEPNLFFENTTSRMDRQVLHLVNDQALDELIGHSKENLYRLTDYVRLEHEKRFDEPLRISRKSLACEIQMHYKVYLLALKMQKKMNNRLVRKAIRSTEVIDCGDKNCDTNRFVWDFLCHFTREYK